MADQENFPFNFSLNIFFFISQWKVLLQRRYGPHFQEHHWIADGLVERECSYTCRKMLWWEAHADPSMATTFSLTERLVLKKEGHFFSCIIFSNVILTSRSNNHNNTSQYFCNLHPNENHFSLASYNGILVLMKCKRLIIFDLNKNRSELMIIIDYYLFQSRIDSC